MEKQKQLKGKQRRKLISKVHKKNKKRISKFAQRLEQTVTGNSEGLGSFLNDNNPEMSFDIKNLVSSGHGRKMKKKMKKLQKKYEGEGSSDKIFKQMQRHRQNIFKHQQKTIFNPANLLQQRRDKRMKKMEANAKKTKTEILQKVVKK